MCMWFPIPTLLRCHTQDNTEKVWHKWEEIPTFARYSGLNLEKINFSQ